MFAPILRPRYHLSIWKLDFLFSGHSQILVIKCNHWQKPLWYKRSELTVHCVCLIPCMSFSILGHDVHPFLNYMHVTYIFCELNILGCLDVSTVHGFFMPQIKIHSMLPSLQAGNIWKFFQITYCLHNTNCSWILAF